MAAKGIHRDESGAWELVHGTYWGGLGHAWLQSGDTVYDPVCDELFCAAEYLTRFRAAVIARYSRLEMARLVAESGHWGPWHKENQSESTLQALRALKRGAGHAV